MTDEEKEIRLLVATWMTATKAGDLDTVLAARRRNDHRLRRPYAIDLPQGRRKMVLVARCEPADHCAELTARGPSALIRAVDTWAPPRRNSVDVRKCMPL